MAGLIEGFARAVVERESVKETYGFDPASIVAIITMIMDLIEGCNQDAGRLRSFAEGNRNIGQLVTLRRRCNDLARERGVRGIARVNRAGSQLADAVLAELDSTSGKMGGDVWQAVIDEAAGV